MMNVCVVVYLTALCFGVADDEEPTAQNLCQRMVDSGKCLKHYRCNWSQQYKCHSDICYEYHGQIFANPRTCADARYTNGTTVKCRYVALNDYPPPATSKTPKGFCISWTAHISNCNMNDKIVTVTDNNPLRVEHDYNDEVKARERSEDDCKSQECGGAQWYEVRAENNKLYYSCDEPGRDGDLTADDFNQSNCKKYDYMVEGGKCVLDPCSLYDDEDTCPNTTLHSTECKWSVDQSGKGVCTRIGQNVTVCAKTFNVPDVSESYCAGKGCGSVSWVQSIRGNTYLYCAEKPPPPPVCKPCNACDSCCPSKNPALSVYMPVIAVLSTLVLYWFFSV